MERRGAGRGGGSDIGSEEQDLASVSCRLRMEENNGRREEKAA